MSFTAAASGGLGGLPKTSNANPVQNMHDDFAMMPFAMHREEPIIPPC